MEWAGFNMNIYWETLGLKSDGLLSDYTVVKFRGRLAWRS